MKVPLSIVLVEDEAVVARRLERLTRRILGDQVVSLVCLAGLPEALNHLRHHAIDLLLLDLDLRGRDGFEMLAEATAGAFDTIIVSARHDMALRAFEYGVVDFVPKPFAEERLRQALERLNGGRRGPGQLRYLAVRKGRRVVSIPLSDVLYVQAAGDYSKLHCRGGEEHLHPKTLTQLNRLLPASFVQVHRSYIVDLRQVESLGSRPGSRYYLNLRQGVELPVSRSKVQALRSHFV